MPTELFAGKMSRRSLPVPGYRLRTDAPQLQRQAATMLQAFAQRLLTDLGHHGILLPPAIELWLDHTEQFQVRHSHPDADEIRAVLETPSYYLHFKTLETLYELLECTRTGTLADSSHLHIGLSSGGPLAFLCVRANGTHPAGQQIRHQGCAASG
ncbi:hypothetical protein BXU06_01380 [Aquaspirillum sp. LM1]|uniref:hypothetical protein n=1 Tax=Aquaspirillum sp. LM1 TaxID=1938604 RepID=UPI000983ACDB|nr:hypothetical protein [Aquaspirillum sp. LM1]AQR63866.1 hypothetical protein BXU06_01380 [Aquaspirillum sp. LM1]